MPDSQQADLRQRVITVRASILTAIVERFERSGRSIQPVMNRVGLTRSQLADPYGSIPLSRFVGFLEAASLAFDDPHLGARLGADITGGDLGPAGLVLTLSESIDRGLGRFARYANALQDGSESHWVQHGEDRVFSYSLQDDRIWPRRQDAEFSLVSLTQVIRDNFTRRWTPKQVHFEHASGGNAAELERYFGCPVRFLKPINRLIVAPEDYGRAFRAEDTALLLTLKRHIGDLIGQPSDLHTARDNVLAYIQANLGLSPVSVSRVAEALQTSPRSLQRALTREGTSLRSLLEQTRRSRAQLLLAEPGAKVSHVAFSLGYTDPTAFWRSYCRWFGSAPSRSYPAR